MRDRDTVYLLIIEQLQILGFVSDEARDRLDDLLDMVEDDPRSATGD